MTTVTISCDRCRSVVSGPRTELAVESWGGPSGDRRESIDLCPRCSGALADWLRASALTYAPLRKAVSSAG